MLIRDRIKDFRRVPAKLLRSNPHNWRTHPEAQQSALLGVLAEVGFADALLARELPDGSLELIDGHLRAETVGDFQVPVLVLDVDQAEADKILATLDPLAGLAEADGERLTSLLTGLETSSTEVQALLDQIAADNGIDWDSLAAGEEAEEPAEPVPVPDMYKVIVTCPNEERQKQLLEQLSTEGWECRALVL